MSGNDGQKLTEKINESLSKMEEFKRRIESVNEEIEAKQTEIEGNILQIVSKRKLSMKERTERMIPLMEQQDLLKEFLEDLDTLEEKQNE